MAAQGAPRPSDREGQLIIIANMAKLVPESSSPGKRLKLNSKVLPLGRILKLGRWTSEASGSKRVPQHREILLI